MPYEQEVREYIEKLGRPVTREEIFAGMRWLAENKVAAALSALSRKVTRQNVRAGAGYFKSILYYLPDSWLKDNGGDKIPRSTAKGLCRLPTVEQDIYVKVCHDLCPFFGACAEDMKAYFENNGKVWKYETKSIDRLKGRFGKQ
ncbi:MAG: hypothetical protein QXD77_00585 [Candidatus Aenigmatarchaeota archaeon]